MTLELRWRQRDGERLLFVVHGYAEHPASALTLGAILDPTLQLRLCAPKGPLVISDDRHAFYRVDFKARQVELDSFTKALDDIGAALDEACEIVGRPREDAVLAGFSQGAGLALATCFGRSRRPPPARLVLFSPVIYDDDLVDWDFSKQMPSVFWTHGDQDDIVSLERAKVMQDRLASHGVPVESLDILGGQHVLIPEGLAAGRDWLAREWIAQPNRGSTED
ncbi:MAG: phospholipase/carboxylesterase [Acidimicrobiales bacterium]|jgi:phospholipase/carboxylesterase